MKPFNDFMMILKNPSRNGRGPLRNAYGATAPFYVTLVKSVHTKVNKLAAAVGYKFNYTTVFLSISKVPPPRRCYLGKISVLHKQKAQCASWLRKTDILPKQQRRGGGASEIDRNTLAN